LEVPAGPSAATGSEGQSSRDERNKVRMSGSGKNSGKLTSKMPKTNMFSAGHQESGLDPDLLPFDRSNLPYSTLSLKALTTRTENVSDASAILTDKDSEALPLYLKKKSV
jgi:hypothetical protein